MKAGTLLMWLMFFLALMTVIQRNPFHAVLMRMALSAVAVGAYALYLAPDVAIAEAMLGAILTTFVYILILKVPGRIRVGYVPVRFLFEEHSWGFEGIQYEIINKFAKDYGYKLEYERFENLDDLVDALESGYVDLGCGPIVIFEEELGILETRIYRVGEKEMDFLSLQNEMLDGNLNEVDVNSFRTGWYTIGFSSSHREFKEFLRDMRMSGLVDKIRNKYVR